MMDVDVNGLQQGLIDAYANFQKHLDAVRMTLDIICRDLLF